jgi:copper transport protein
LRSNPAPGAILASPPTEILLVFSEKPELALSSVRLISPAGDTSILSPLRRDPIEEKSLVAPVPANAGDGTYRILWRAAASDGHTLRGTVDFAVHVTPAMQTQSLPDSSAVEAKEKPVMFVATGGAFMSIFARWLTFASTFLIIGVVTFRMLVLRRMSNNPQDLFVQIASTNAATLGIVAAVASNFASVLKLTRESADMPDAPLSSMMFGSFWGFALLLQIIAALIAGAAFIGAHKDEETTKIRAWRIAILAALLLAIAPALGGHAFAADRAFIAVPADIVHVAFGSMWLGTLAVIVIVGIPAAFKAPDSIRPGERVAGIINTFSPVALTCGGVVVATGLASSLMHLPTLATLWTSLYGVALLLKLFFVALLFAAGAWNWQRMKPRLTGENAIGPLRSSASLELVLGAVVLTITAILVALELP